MASGADKLRHAPTGRQSGLSGPLGRHFTAIDRVLIVCEGSASCESLILFGGCWRDRTADIRLV